MILSCQGDRYGHLDTSNTKICLVLILSTVVEIFLVLFLATKEALAPLANDPIKSGRSIRSFRHLKLQNLSTGDDFIYSSGIIFQFHFWPPRRHWRHLKMIMQGRSIRRSLVPIFATRELVAPLANDPIMQVRLILSFRHLKHQNLSTSDDLIHYGLS